MPDAPGSAEEPRRPHELAAASPHLAPDPPPPPARRRSALPIAVGAIAAAAIVLGVLLWALAPRNTSVTLAGGDKGRVLEPIQPRADAQTGEQVAPFSGFAVSVDSDPSGAVISVQGVPRGEAPVLAGLDCSPGDRIEIAAEKRGFPVTRTWTTCRRDALVKLTVRLRR